jgi:GTP-binding protein
MLNVAIVGRPNVGKSTLFNLLALDKKSIVHDSPGVTRDFIISNARIGNFYFQIIDTAGLESKTELTRAMLEQTKIAIEKADVLLFITDGKSGVTEEDREYAKFLRKFSKPIILAVNKTESMSIGQLSEFYSLGFKNICNLSSAHKMGLDQIHEQLQSFEHLAKEVEDKKTPNQDKIKLAIIGRPNAGKSTLINNMLSEQRLLTADFSGTTRDSVEVEWAYKGKNFVIVDTAGLRKKKNLEKTADIERAANAKTIASLNKANVVILLCDVTIPLEKQDLSIAKTIINEGKGLIIIFNKTDLVSKEHENYLAKLPEYVKNLVADVKNIPLFFISSTKPEASFKIVKKNNDKFDILRHPETKNSSYGFILDAAINVYESWNIKLKTSELNEWLNFVINQHQPPLAKNKRPIKLKFINQIASRPPSFQIFCNIADDIPISYKRYLLNSLQTDYKLVGTPTRIEFKNSANPYNK